MRKRCVKGALFSLLGMLCILLTGCWDSMEINNRSVILEFYLDKGEENLQEAELSPEEMPRYKVTYSIPDMAKLSGTEGLSKDMKEILVVKAPTIGKSLEQVQTKTKNTLTLSHVKALLLGDALLKDGELLKEALESMNREQTFARNTPILAVDKEAGSVSEVENPQHPIVGLYIMHYFNNKERPMSHFKHQLLGNFTRDMEDTGAASLPLLTVEEEDQINISGGAVLKDYAFVDYLTPEEVKGQLLIEGQVKRAPVVIEYEKKYLTYLINSQTSKVSFEKGGTGLEATIEIEAKGNITEYPSVGIDGFTSYQKEQIKALLEQELEKEVQRAVDKSKEIEVDFLKIGLEMYRTKPKWWKEYEKEWQQGGYLKVPIKVKAKVQIENTGVSS